MKKTNIVTLLILISLCLVFVPGCFNKQDKPAANLTDLPETQLKGQPDRQQEEVVVNTDERPIAVMIDNEGIATSRHSGLDKAFAVYEMIVEGSDSRLMALFKGVNPAVIGPVRSSRHYFIHYAMEHDAVYVHFGWSPLAQKTISDLHVNNINGVTSDGSIFWRNPVKRTDWHNAFTSMEKIKNLAKKKKYRDTTTNSVFSYSPKEVELNDGVAASKVDVVYSGFKKIKYEYDGKTKLYKRFVGTKPHTDAVSGVQYTAKNVIIERVKNYSLGDGPDFDGKYRGRQQMDTVGTGKGYLITNGKCVDITWKKDKSTERTIYKYQDGSEVMFNKGQIWIQIVPINSKVDIK
ncbi:MAG: DUF3048 domain-containing protein [Deltaproteobacteria bacterium]